MIEIEVSFGSTTTATRLQLVAYSHDVYSGLEVTLKRCRVTPPLISLPFPRLLLSISPSLEVGPLNQSFPPSLTLAFSPPYPSLEVGPLNRARRSGECCKLPQWVWAEPDRHTLSGTFLAYVDRFWHEF